MAQCETPWTDQSCCPEDLLPAWIWQGTWVSGTTYAVNAAVESGQSTWVCIKAHTADGTNKPPANAAATPTTEFWELMALGGSVLTWEGSWDAGTAYQINDAVQHLGSAYVALLSNTAIEPGTDPLVWDLLVAGQVGTSSGYVQQFSDDTDTSVDPGDGSFTINAGNTEIATDDLNDLGADIRAWILDFAGGTTPDDLGQITLKDLAQPNLIWGRYLIKTVTGDTGFSRLGIELVDGAGVFVNFSKFSVEFARTGDKGVDSAGDMLQATYDPAGVSEQLIGATAAQTMTNKTITNPVFDANVSFSGDNPEILGGDTNGVATISANSAILGGILKLYGDTHASKPSDFEFLADADVAMFYDASAELFSFGITTPLEISTAAIAPKTDLALNAGTPAERFGQVHGQTVLTDAIELGDATDTTLTRAGAGRLAVEGVEVLMSSLDLAQDPIQINGSHEVSQENISSSVVLTTAVAAYITDMWKLEFTSGTAVVNGQRVAPAGTPPVGYQFALEMEAATGAATAAGDYFIYQNMVEGWRIAQLGWGAAGARAVTLGFWVSASIAGTMAVSIQNGAQDRSYVVDIVINAPDTWEFKTVTIPGDVAGSWSTQSAIGLMVVPCFGAGATFQTAPDTWAAGNFLGTASTTNFMATNGNLAQVTGLSIITGTHTLTPEVNHHFQRSFGEEEALASRYFEKSWPHDTPIGTGGVTGGMDFTFITAGIGLARFATPFLVQKSVTPTMQNWDNAGNIGTVLRDITNQAGSFTVASERNAQMDIPGPLSAIEFFWHWTADARL